MLPSSHPGTWSLGPKGALEHKEKTEIKQEPNKKHPKKAQIQT